MKTLVLTLLVITFSGGTFAQNPWIIEASHVDQNNYTGVTVGNGTIGIVSSPLPLKTGRIVLYGNYDKELAQNAFNLFELSLRIDGEEPNLKNITDYRQTLNMKEGAFSGTFQLRDKARVKYTYYALRQLPFVVLLDIEVEPLKDIRIHASNFIENPSVHWDSYANYKDPVYKYREISAKVNCLSITAKNVSGTNTLTGMTSFLFSGNEILPIRIRDRIGNAQFRAEFEKPLKAGEKYAFSVAGSVLSSAYFPDPYTECERIQSLACLEGREILLAKHKKEWDKLWESDILIEGDAQVQQDIHNILYHLYSFVREGSGFSIPPHGLSELDYNSHIFWDADIWMLPALALLHPDMAKSLVEYRFDRMEQAKRIAFSRGYRGAMYPWESAMTGFEETQSGFLTGAFEQHITADVAIGAWNYYCVTRDLDWLKEKGFPVIRECADFWISRVEPDGNGKYEIRNVIGADEYAINVDNDAYTNGAARKNLEIAISAAKLIGVEPNKDWGRIAPNIIIHQFENGVTQEFKGYRGQKITQADANLLVYPLGIITDKNQIRKDLDYYETKFDENGPAMTYCMFALQYAKMGEPEKAFKYFQKSYIPCKRQPFGVISERPDGAHAFFITAGGGILQSVMMGFGGLEITPNGIEQKQGILPQGWKSLTFKGIGTERKSYKVTR